MPSVDNPDIFRAIVDPTRRAILHALQRQTLQVSEICGLFSLTQGAVSQHLKILRDAELVRVTKDGRRRRYEINPLPLLEVFHWVMHYHRFWPNRLDRLEAYLDGQQDEA